METTNKKLIAKTIISTIGETLRALVATSIIGFGLLYLPAKLLILANSTISTIFVAVFSVLCFAVACVSYYQIIKGVYADIKCNINYCKYRISLSKIKGITWI